jgi:hypothetical protein
MAKPKLYLFAIGGTGSRVLRSLTMLLASGVQINAEKVIPMIIDTDVNNGDVEKCRSIIKNYNEIHNAVYNGVQEGEGVGEFFRPQILPPKELNISGTDYGTLKEMVGYNSLDAKGFDKTRALFDLLYNNSNKDMPLEKGFLGNPNVGSVVLKNVVESNAFREFTQDFNQNDRIFIVSSIFGGTGAAGFPLLMNIFRDEMSSLNNGNYINNSIIGGVSVLPYFQVDVEKFNIGESAINSSTFITKSKAALSYYHRNLKQLVNAMYYVGDTRQSVYENFDGGVEQKNPSNFIEITAATSVIDFMEYDVSANNREDLQTDSKFFEYGINSDVPVIDFNHLKNDNLKEQLLCFHYYNVYVSNFMKKALSNKKLAWHNELGLPNNYYGQKFYKSIEKFSTIHYYRWLLEVAMNQHDRKFLPFDISIISNKEDVLKDVSNTTPVKINLNDKKLFTLVTGIPAANNSSWLRKDAINYDEEFSKIARNVLALQYGSLERNIHTLLNKGIKNIVNERYVL